MKMFDKNEISIVFSYSLLTHISDIKVKSEWDTKIFRTARSYPDDNITIKDYGKHKAEYVFHSKDICQPIKIEFRPVIQDYRLAIRSFLG